MAGWLSGCLGGCLDFCHGLQLSGCDDQIWQGCGLSRAEVERYGRQVVLPSLGPEGQKKLLRGSVLIVGAGGLGCPVALYLAAAGVGRIGLVDADTVALSNLHRQIGHLARSVGVNKATSLAKACRELNATVQLEVCPQRLSRLEETAELIARYDLVVDCTDTPPSRYLLNDGALCAQRPLVAASAVGLSGQLAVYNFEGGPCLRCVFPVSLADAEPVASCEEHGVLGPIVGTVGSLAALEVIKVLAKGSALHKSCLRGKLLLFDPTSSLQPCRTVKIHRQADCAGCAPKDGAAPPMPPAGCAMPLPREEISISPIELHSRLLAHRPTFLLDVRLSFRLKAKKRELAGDGAENGEATDTFGAGQSMPDLHNLGSKDQKHISAAMAVLSPTSIAKKEKKDLRRRGSSNTVDGYADLGSPTSVGRSQA